MIDTAELLHQATKLDRELLPLIEYAPPLLRPLLHSIAARQLMVHVEIIKAIEELQRAGR